MNAVLMAVWPYIACFEIDDIRGLKIYSFLSTFAKVQEVTVSIVVSIRMLPLEGFSLNLVFEYSLKICRKYTSFIKIGQG
jgi:hypothetical protein